MNCIILLFLALLTFINLNKLEYMISLFDPPPQQKVTLLMYIMCIDNKVLMNECFITLITNINGQLIRTSE